MRKPLFYALSVALLPLLVGMDGCMANTLNHCVASPEASGCPELCIDDPDLEHCSELPDTILIDGGLCGKHCTVTLPFCDEATLECVECTAEVGCECVGDADCPDEAPVCGADGQCGGCSETLDCSGRARPVCDDTSGACIGCTEDSQCTHLSNTPVCDEASGRCAECTVETEAMNCPAADGQETGPACDPIELTCTGALRGTLSFCDACLSDSECASHPSMGTMRCVPMLFDATAHGNYCLFDIGEVRVLRDDDDISCGPQMTAEWEETSVLGIPSVYCSPPQGLTTCEAVLDLGSDHCGDDNSLCGAEGVNDGICLDGRCTHLCSRDEHCPGGTVDSCGGVVPTTCDPTGL